MKTKFEIELEEFDKQFRRFKDKKIVIYGIGRMTATLIGAQTEYKIVGLCDRDTEKVGDIVYGLPIISRKEAETVGDILIINTAATYWKTIYSRISDWNIPIYYRNGEKAELDLESVDEEEDYWESRIDTIRDMSRNVDIVSFDVFNTLVQRCYCNEMDLFELVKRQNRISYDFEEARKKAAAMSSENATIAEIYEIIQENEKIGDEETKRIEKAEFDLDLRFVVGRQPMVEFCKEIQKKKRVFFISDMYYSAEQIQDVLRKVGIRTDKRDIIVSSEVKCCKADGSLWKFFVEQYMNHNVLHIGDDYRGDVEKSKEYGVQAFQIKSAYDLLGMSSIKRIMGKVMSPFSSVVMGLINAKIFQDPFALNQTKGHILFENNEAMGYCVLGPIAYTFNKWLMESAIREGLDKILFFSREGYLLAEEYKTLSELIGQEGPDIEQLMISRRAIMNVLATNKDMMLEIASFPYRGSLRDFLKDRFNLDVAIEEEENISVEGLGEHREELWEILKPYAQSIFEEAKRQRRNYLGYLETVGIEGNIGIVDSFLYGSTQFYLGKLLNRDLQGFYFLVNQGEDNECIANQHVSSCFQDKDDINGKNNEIWNYALFLEAFYTAPYGMVIEIDENGDAIYGEKQKNQENYEIRVEMQKGIIQFIKDFVSNTRDIPMELDIPFVRSLFDVFMNGGFIKSEGMKKSFFYDNAILNREQVPIFE